ncbi:phosphoenolpyruvate--protein phosphotransferase [Puniceicoccaceae bacterium K14]|nr:phosphoenolpyruvate--protein phosphotransferase [Puniceicoccaceae bacterium K14]
MIEVPKEKGSAFKTRKRIQGKSISPGLAEGTTFIHYDLIRSLDTKDAIHFEDIEEELGCLDDATSSISDDLIALATRVERQMDTRLGAVFEAHQLMLNDPTLREELRNEIIKNLTSASGAVKAVFLRWEKRFLRMESQIARHKGDDMRDLSNRLSNALAGIKIHPLETFPISSVIVARRLLPSDTIFLSQNSASAVLLEYGGAGSHAALFAREMGLPCIADISDILKCIPAGAPVLVDANVAEAILCPIPKEKLEHHRKVEASRKTQFIAWEKAQEPTETLDGTTILVCANVGCPIDTQRAIANGADGIGLYRTEQAYLGRATPPKEDELLDEMRRTLKLSDPKTACIRLLDTGSDKQLPFVGFLAESNPALGLRGIRLLKEYPKLLETQLRAILTLSLEFNISVLIPMISTPHDVAFVKNALNRIGAGMGITKLPPLGAMIETPGAALNARQFSEHIDFISFGTNDLTQYAFAADRENAAVETYFDDSSDAIFRLLRIVHDDVPHLPLSICGELAGNTASIQRLLDCGIRTLSVAPPLIPIIKETVRSTRIQSIIKPYLAD